MPAYHEPAGFTATGSVTGVSVTRRAAARLPALACSVARRDGSFSRVMRSCSCRSIRCLSACSADSFSCPLRYQFGFHPVGADLCQGKVFGLAAKGVAIAVDIKRKLAVKDIRLVVSNALLQSGKLRIVAVVRDIKHIPVRHEAESVDRIRLLLRRQRQQQGEGQQYGQ